MRCILKTSAVTWEGFDRELERVTSQLEEAEEKLKTFDHVMPTSYEEANEKIRLFQVGNIK